MTMGLFNFLSNKFSTTNNRRVDALKDFSLAAPSALDTEQLTDVIAILGRFGWDAKKAARYVNDALLIDFDDALLEKGDDPFGTDIPPGPSC